MKYQRGFTLLEVLVVIVIIGMVVSITTISGNSDPRQKHLAVEAKRLKFFLEIASDEAVFQNKDLGFFITKTEVHPFELIVTTPSETENNDQQDNKVKIEWVAYQSRRIKPLTLPEDYSFEAKIDGNDLVLPFNVPEKKEDIIPQFIIASSGQQPVSEFILSIEEYKTVSVVLGEGLGRFDTEQITYEQ